MMSYMLQTEIHCRHISDGCQQSANTSSCQKLAFFCSYLNSLRAVGHFVTVLVGVSLAAIWPISTHCSVAWSVCLLSVGHSCAPCLNRLTDLDAIWQVHLWRPMTHCVRWGFWPPGKGRFGSQTPQPKQPNRQSYAATWRIGLRSLVDIDSAIYQITLVYV